MSNFADAGVRLIAQDKEKFEKDVGDADSAVQRFAQGAVKAGKLAAVGIGVGVAAITGIGAASLSAAVDWESAFAGVVKTVDTTDEELAKLEDSLRGIARTKPIDTDDIAAIAELGGQLGVVNKDTEDVTGTLTAFTEAIAGMGVATNLSTEEAATGMAQFANIMQTTSREGTAAFDKIGSTIVKLGNNSATTERDILEFSQRIAAAGSVAGLTEAELLGISAAFPSIGIGAEAGGTAVSKALGFMNDAVAQGGEQLEIFAATAGMTGEEFADVWEDQPADAFQAFVQGLGAAGDDASLILDAVGLSSSQATRAFLGMAQNSQLLTDSINYANDGWRENEALTKEAEARYATTESQIKIVKNVIKDLAITIGKVLLPFLKDMLLALQPMIKEFAEKFPDLVEQKLKPVLEAVVGFLGEFIPKAISTLMQFWNAVLLPAIITFVNFVQTSVIPIINNLVQWLQVYLPVAIQTLTSFFTGTLVPAFEKIVGFVKENLVPILGAIAIALMTVVIPAVAAWAAANVAAAIATIAAWAPIIAGIALLAGAIKLLMIAWQNDFGGIQTKTKEVWENTIKPVFEGIKDWIQNTVIPAVEKLVEWFKVNVPKAFEEVKKFWENTLKPALEDLWDFISESVIPIIEDVFNWLKTNIPEAFEEVKKFWEETLKPALEALWAFVRDNVIPIIEKAYDWLKVKIPEAFETVKQFWLDTLQPALQEIWDFFSENIIPIIEEVVAWFKDKIPEAWQKLQDAWNEILKPLLEKIWKFIEDPVIKILSDLWDWIAKEIPGAFNVLRDFWYNTGAKLLELIIGGFGAIVQKIESIIAKAKEAIDWLRDLLSIKIELPFGLGSAGVAPAAGAPALGAQAGLAGPTALLPNTVATSPAAGAGLSLTFNTTINSEMDARNFEQRVIRVVAQNIG